MAHKREAGQSGDEMRSAIEAIDRCRDVCLGTAVTFCLRMGGEHAAQAHMRLMLECAEICRTAGAFMLMDSPYGRDVCAVCAEVCEDCAASCERVGDMQECVDICRRCAESCQLMVGTEPHLRAAAAVARAKAAGREAQRP
jgi:hypothetical protein